MKSNRLRNIIEISKECKNQLHRLSTEKGKNMCVCMDFSAIYCENDLHAHD